MIEPKPEFWATVTNWVDGDTLDMMVDQWFRIYSHRRFRVLEVDTPERGEPGWAEATAFGRSFAPVGTTVALRSHKSDSFGRWLAEVELPDGTSYAFELIDKGFAVPYNKN